MIRSPITGARSNGRNDGIIQRATDQRLLRFDTPYASSRNDGRKDTLTPVRFAHGPSPRGGLNNVGRNDALTLLSVLLPTLTPP